MESQDLFEESQAAQARKTKRVESRVRQINTEWTTEKINQLIEEVQKYEPIWDVLNESYEDRELRNRNWNAENPLQSMASNANWNGIPFERRSM